MPANVFEAMGFPPKVRTALAKARPPITVIGDLIALTPAQVLAMRGLGPIALGEIEIVLRTHRLSLAPRTIGGADHD